MAHAQETSRRGGHVHPRGRVGLRRRLRRTLHGLLLVALTTAFAAGQRGEDPQSAERAARLEQLRGEIREAEQRLERARAAVSTLTERLRQTRLEMELQRALVAEADLELQGAQISLTASEERTSRLENEAAALREQAGDRIATLARYGRGGYLRLLMSIESDPGGDPRPAARTLRYLVRRDGVTLERLRQALAALAAERSLLVERRSAAAAWFATQSEREASLDALRDRQAQLLARARREADRIADRSQRLELRRERLEGLVALLASERSPDLGGEPIQSFRGALDWPLEGRVAIPFGPRRDPRYGTEVPHDGVAIACESGARVGVVYPGRVRYADDFKGLGSTVIVQHEERVFSLYAGLGSVRVEPGDVLSLGALLGTCEARLYLEFRAPTKAEDPREWLR